MNERVDILNEGIKLTTNDRNETYGSFVDNMDLLGRMWQLYTGAIGDRYCAGHDAAIFHVLGKICRIASGSKLHRDNYIDGAVYLAAAYECQIADTEEAEVTNSTLLDAAKAERENPIYKEHPELLSYLKDGQRRPYTVSSPHRKFLCGRCYAVSHASGMTRIKTCHHCGSAQLFVEQEAAPDACS